MADQTTSGCGCGTMTLATQATEATEPCGCGCSTAPKSAAEEIADLQRLRDDVEQRLTQLEDR